MAGSGRKIVPHLGLAMLVSGMRIVKDRISVSMQTVLLKWSTELYTPHNLRKDGDQ